MTERPYNPDFLALMGRPVPAWIVDERGHLVKSTTEIPAKHYWSPRDPGLITTPMPGRPFFGVTTRAWVREKWVFWRKAWVEDKFAVYAKRVTVRFLRRKWRALKAFIVKLRNPK
jgi:hypothetical protein